jgi:uncharacterized protein
MDAPTIMEWVVLCSAAVAAGIVNSVAGGGTLLTFPALVWILGPTAPASVIANATSTITVCPGSIASAWGYRRELFDMRRWILPLMVPSILGSCVGTWLVAKRAPEEFLFLVPWLILLATVLFLLQPWISRRMGIGKPRAIDATASTASSESPLHRIQHTNLFWAGIISFQFLIALYGGYFGAGIGILMLSTLALMGISNIHQMNSLKSLLAGTINGVAVILFVGFGKVDWRLALPMMVASVIGGFLGAVIARRLDKNLVRYSVIAIGLTLSIYYFVRTYLA